MSDVDAVKEEAAGAAVEAADSATDGPTQVVAVEGGGGGGLAQAVEFGKLFSGRLTKSLVFVRVRPYADSGGHAQTDESVSKSLTGWGESGVKIATEYMFSKGSESYTYPQRVFGPEVSQDDVFATVSPSIMEKIMGGYNTGSGKTHTMFGTDESLSSGSAHPMWGLFPRMTAALFTELNAEQSAGKSSFVLTASAIEFYMTVGYDLLDNHCPIEVNTDHLPIGLKEQRLKSVADLMPYLATVRKQRTSRSTDMNPDTADHDGSSRSHAALILRIYKLERASGKFRSNTFILVDMAGAERINKSVKKKPKSAKQEQADKFATQIAALGGAGLDVHDWGPKWRGWGVSADVQANCINIELSNLGMEVRKATEAHKKKAKYTPPRNCVTGTIKFLGSLLDGRALLSMMVCLSPAGQNGWETWYSLEYGKDLSKLAAPAGPVKAVSVKSALKAAEDAKNKAATAFESTPKPGSGKPSAGYYYHRRSALQHAATYYEHVKSLSDESSV